MNKAINRIFDTCINNIKNWKLKTKRVVLAFLIFSVFWFITFCSGHYVSHDSATWVVTSIFWFSMLCSALCLVFIFNEYIEYLNYRDIKEKHLK